MRRRDFARNPVASPGAASRLLALHERWVAIDKAAGVSLATPASHPQAAVSRLIESLTPEDRARLGDSELLLVHRLDVGTSGLVLLARDAAAHRELATALAERRVEKRYLAIVWGRPRPGEGEWNRPLGPDRRDRRRMCLDPAGRPALTTYRVLAAKPPIALVELQPRTGRTHQLRVHLATAGHPIVGDDLYGGPRHHGVRDAALCRRLAPPRPLLHAWRLSVTLSWSGEPLRLLAAPPEDFRALRDDLGERALAPESPFC